MSVVGIDFGTYSCTVAVRLRSQTTGHAEVKVVTSEAGAEELLSLITYGDEDRKLSTKGDWKANIPDTVSEVKRLLGRKFARPDLQQDTQRWWYKVDADANGDAVVHVSYQNTDCVLRPEQVAAVLFVKLRDLAAAKLQRSVTDCVISVPTYFTDGERRAVLDAAKIAGLNVLRLVSDALAVGIEYSLGIGRRDGEDKRVAIVDFGHGSLTVSIADLKAGKSVRILSSVADRSLGGRDVDQLLFQRIVKQHKLTLKPKQAISLMGALQTLKKHLSSGAQAEQYLDLAGKDLNLSLTREDFEELCAPLIARAAPVFERAFALAEVDPAKDLKGALLVGGSKHIAWFQNLVTQTYKIKDLGGVDWLSTASKGCAWQCAMLSPFTRAFDLDVVDVNTYAIEAVWGQTDAKTGDFVEEERSELFGVGNQVPSIKQMVFQKTEPFEIRLRYSDPAQIPAGVEPLLARYVVHLKDVAPNADGKTPKTKVRIELTLHGTVALRSSHVVEEIIPDPTPEPEPESPAAPTEAKEETAEAPAAAETPEEPAAEAATPPAAADDSTPASGDASPAPDAAAPADAAAAAATDEKKKPKKKTRKRTIPTDEIYTNGLRDAQIASFQEEEMRQQQVDRELLETEHMRHALESYAIETKGKIEKYGSLHDFVEPGQVDSLSRQLYEAGEFAEFGGNQSKAALSEALAAVQKAVQPIEQRKWETENRGPAVKKFRDTVAGFSAFTAQHAAGEEKYAHIAPEQVAEVVAAVTDAEAWFQPLEVEQASREGTLHADPAFTCSALWKRIGELEKLAGPIQRTPVPKPEPVPEPEPEPTKDADEAAAAAAAGGDATAAEKGAEDAPVAAEEATAGADAPKA